MNWKQHEETRQLCFIVGLCIQQRVASSYKKQQSWTCTFSLFQHHQKYFKNFSSDISTLVSSQVRIQVSTCIIPKHMDKPKWTFACKNLFWSITYNYKELYLSLITSRRKRGSKNNGGRDYPSSRNRSRTSIKCGEVNSPVRKPQDRRIDSVNVHVEPYTKDPCRCHIIRKPRTQ
jgi:hypothetical protein